MCIYTHVALQGHKDSRVYPVKRDQPAVPDHKDHVARLVRQALLDHQGQLDQAVSTQ